MPASDRGGLKAAFTNFNRRTADAEAEVKLLGREVSEPELETSQLPATYQVPPSYTAATPSPLVPKPLLQREPVRQLSFRCGVSLANELKRKASYNQLEQQEIIAEGIRRVLLELPDPPSDWQP
jgi:hypothetical protein